MRILITGATGFIGRALVLRLRREGHEIVAWTRSTSKGALLGTEVETLPVTVDDAELTRALERCQGVVNLAGAPIVGRWTAAKKKELFDSRVAVTKRLVCAIEGASTRPRVMVSASAIGYYGGRCGAPVDETSDPGSGFLAELAVAWEAAAMAAASLGVRVTTIRTGVVLGREGGVLARLLPIFRLGLGGPVGGGEQYVSWIHLDDVVSVIAAALVDERYAGAINVTAPAPVTNAELARALGRALGRPALLRVPAPVLRLALGEAACVLLEGPRVEPSRLRALGHKYAFADLDGALSDLIARGAEIERLARAPRFVLTTKTVLDTTPEEAFSFFSHPQNLALVTPPRLRLAVEKAPATLSTGARVDLRLRIARLPMRWTTRIEAWQPGRRFVDSQTRGPYRTWWHEHSFEPEDGRTVMTDRVLYAVPLGILGRAANRLFVAPSLRRIFGFRREAVRQRFGGGPA